MVEHLPSHHYYIQSFGLLPTPSLKTPVPFIKMKLTLSALAALVATATSTAVDLEKRDSPLSVSLAQVEDSKVKVALTNNDETSYKLFYKGTFLDHAPTDKLSVSTDCQ
jgi:hypothetical protein